MSSDDLRKALKTHFGFDDFRPGQRALVEAALAGHDALGILPTGGGKSLTYQLPAMLSQGTTVVVSPLIALMKDQVDAFNKRNKAHAVALHSNLKGDEIGQALRLVQAGEVKLLYVAPERLEYAGFRDLLLSLKPQLFVVDEAHCVSAWGYDFRPAYRLVKECSQKLRPCAVLALTATATPAVRKDIALQLGLKNPVIQVSPFDRPNLRFEVKEMKATTKPSALRNLLQTLKGGSAIVYVGRRKDAEEISKDLNKQGLGSVAYHAGMTGNKRHDAQEAWLKGKKPIAVATVAFGMGIDNPDVRLVIHYQHPASLEAYYQEAGRAGRDGKPARCVVFFSGKDVGLANFFIGKRYPERHEVQQLYDSIAEDGHTAEDLEHLRGPESPEARNVALHVLQENGLIFRDANGLICKCEHNDGEPPINLNGMYQRKSADYERLKTVVAYCKDAACHRASLLKYFGEEHAEDYRCGNCSKCGRAEGEPGVLIDNSEDPEELTDEAPRKERKKRTPITDDNFFPGLKEPVSKTELLARQVERPVGVRILSLIQVTKEELSASKIAVLLSKDNMGRADAKKEDRDWITPYAHLPQYASDVRPYRQVLMDVLAMYAKGYLDRESERSRILRLTAKGKEVLNRVATATT